ncbi:MAG: hypothetical protein QG608_2332 [Actinomycetota bacterium]|nr:hypothetical protein [Actinomycetota bacterium]
MKTTDRWNVSEAVGLPGFAFGGQPLSAPARLSGVTGGVGVEPRLRGERGTGPVPFRIGDNYALRADEGGRKSPDGSVRATAHLPQQMAALPGAFTNFTTKPITGPHPWRPPA